jgi:hypothetical protein
MKNKKISIVVPIHIYNFDPQGNLNQYQKLEMYMLAIEHMKILYKQCNIIICGHGINYSKEFKEYSTHVIWNKDYTEPDKFGLFPGNPAQYKIVSLGCRRALEINSTHIIKVRGDGIMYNSELVLSDLSLKPDKLFITQQTSFKNHTMLGDCYMYGPSDKISEIWDGNKKVYSDDGLIHIGKSFLETFKYKKEDWNKALFDNCEFRDINELEIYDLRWNFDEHSNLFKNNNFLKKDMFLWGAKNNWITYKNFKIVDFDRDIFYTKKLFIFMKNLKINKLNFINKFVINIFKKYF